MRGYADVCVIALGAGIYYLLKDIKVPCVAGQYYIERSIDSFLYDVILWTTTLLYQKTHPIFLSSGEQPYTNILSTIW